MSGFPQNESNMFSLLRSNYTCISDEQAKELAKIITTNNEIKNSGSVYSGTSFELYNSDGFIKTVKSANAQPKKKQSEIDALIDEDSFPVKMQKTIFDKFADWLSGFEISDDTEALTLKDMGVEEKEPSFTFNIHQDLGIFKENMVQDQIVESENGIYS